MDKEDLRKLLEHAANELSSYAQAIDGQLYSCGSYYNNEKEEEVRTLAAELQRVAEDL